MNNLYEKKEGILYELYRFEADQMWRFIGKKENKKRQIVAFMGADAPRKTGRRASVIVKYPPF
jgi:hypothetical protein